MQVLKKIKRQLSLKGTKELYSKERVHSRRLTQRRLQLKVNKRMSAKEFKKLKKNLKKAGFKGKIKK